MNIEKTVPKKTSAVVKNTETATLIASHTHAGKILDAGSVISVNPRQKEFLIKHKKIEG